MDTTTLHGSMCENAKFHGRFFSISLVTRSLSGLQEKPLLTLHHLPSHLVCRWCVCVCVCVCGERGVGVGEVESGVVY